MMPFIRVVALAFALATSSAWSPHPFESSRDQYEARQDTLARQKRSYMPWSTRVVYAEPYPSLNIWRPSVYPISRPYVIPVYGVQGGYRIYYPPQQLFVNTPPPRDNPFTGPPYLPPKRTTTTTLPPPATTMSIGDRFNGGDNSDDKFVWPEDERPVKPTRPTRPPGAVKTPPLVHNPTDPEGFADAPPVAATTTPPPPRPQRPAAPSEPSRCVWAIISCCSSSNQISYECFDQRGCTGAFWDDNPCDSDFARAAVAAALQYYNKK